MTRDKQKKMKILLAVDGSQNALAATNLLCDLPLGADSSITVVAVVDTPHTPRRSLLMAALDQTERILKDKPATLSSGLLSGHPAQALCDFAEAEPPDLIVLGAVGLRATLGILLGGVAQQVVEYARWPTLVVRAPYHGLKNLLLITDGSSYAQNASEFLQAWPFKEDTLLRVMHVLPPSVNTLASLRPWMLGTEAVLPVSIETEEEFLAREAQEERQGKELLERTVNRFNAQDIPTLSVLQRGDAATEIIKVIKENAIDLVIAGGRGLSAVKGWLLGSVSRKLVHYASCSVLIVK
jgi:nucleotide-binding universal stress UspA family protein